MTDAAARLTPLRLLLWCAAGTALAQLVIWSISERGGVSPIFWYLIRTYDTHGNLLLALIALAAFALRDRADALPLVRWASERPWHVAAAVFPLLCAGSLFVYRAYPLSMDEYSSLFQANVFAAGRLDGAFPPDLLDRLVPRPFQGQFFSVARESGAISTFYWPGYALLAAPFAWAGIPWALNPLLSALTLPAVHAITRQVSGSREAAGWAVLLAAASPAFVVNGISFYSMPAHLLANLWYAHLLLRPTPRAAALAGVVGSIALTLHFPFRHAVFALPFVAWVALQPGRARNLAALALGYLPLGLLLGAAWHGHMMEAARAAAAAPGMAPGAAPAAPQYSLPPSPQSSPLSRALSFIAWPTLATVEARLASLSKVWTWGAAVLGVLAVYGAALGWRNHAIRVLAIALVLNFLAFFLAGGDQGHGWGYRSLHGAWFILPLLAACTLAAAPAVHRMAAWALLLSLVFANGLRLVQVNTFIDQSLRQVPPLAQAPPPGRQQIVFVDIAHGFYTRDMIHNDPFLRGPRIVMVMGSRPSAEALMAARFPEYRKAAEGDWGQLWERPAEN